MRRRAIDGGVLTPADIAAINLDPVEMADYARWVIAAARARETRSVVHLEDGYPPI